MGNLVLYQEIIIVNFILNDWFVYDKNMINNVLNYLLLK